VEYETTYNTVTLRTDADEHCLDFTETETRRNIVNPWDGREWTQSVPSGLRSAPSSRASHPLNEGSNESESDDSEDVDESSSKNLKGKQPFSESGPRTSEYAAINFLQDTKFHAGDPDPQYMVNDNKEHRNLQIFQLISLLFQHREDGEEVTATTMLINLKANVPLFEVHYAKNKLVLMPGDESRANALVQTVKRSCSKSESESIEANFCLHGPIFRGKI